MARSLMTSARIIDSEANDEQDEKGEAAKARQSVTLKDLKPDQWWWD